MAVTQTIKQTVIGAIPSEWEIHYLGDLLKPSQSIRYGIVQPGKFNATGRFMLRSQDYSKGWAGPDGMHKVSLELEYQYRNARIHANDLVMTVVGAGIGQVVIVPAWLDGSLLSRSTARIAIDETKAAPNFVKAFLESPAGKKQILDCQKEGAQPVVSCPDLAKFLVPAPSLSEQRAIATALSDMDALLDGLTRLITKKRDLKQATMQQLLTGQTRLPGFSERWEVKRLGEHLTFLRNGVNSRAELTVEGKVKYLHYGDIHGAASLRLNPSVTPMPHLPVAKAGQLNRLSDGDLVFADASEDLDGVGKSVELCGIGQLEVVSGLHTIAVRFDKQVLADGFKAYLQFIPAFRQHLRRLAAGTKVYATNRAHIASAELTLPDVQEQTAIATVLSDMDAELASLEARLTKTRAVKQAMMSELLTGKTRLPI